jgi:hypothetical protein
MRCHIKIEIFDIMDNTMMDILLKMEGVIIEFMEAHQIFKISISDP